MASLAAKFRIGGSSSKHKAFTNKERLLRHLDSLKEREGVDGVFITDIDEAVEEYGMEQIEAAVASMVDMVNNFKTPLMVLVDGGAFFTENEWLASHTHGIVIHNPTLEPSGEYKLLPRPDLNKVIDLAKAETQRRVDFVTLAHEAIPIDRISGGMVRRFVKWSQDFKVVPYLCTDPTMTLPEMVRRTPTAPMGPVSVLSSPHFDQYFRVFKNYMEGRYKIEEGWQKTIVKEVVTFAKGMGHDVEAGAFQESFVILKEKHKSSAYTVWLGLLAHMFHLLATKVEGSMQDVYEEASNVFRLMVAWQETHKHEEVSMKPSHSTPAVATRDDDWAAKLIEQDPSGPSGQREFGSASYRHSEYRRVVDIQEKLRAKDLLKNLSKPMQRENGGVKEEAYEAKLAEALAILDGVISSPQRHAEVLSGFTKEKNLTKSEIVQQLTELRTGLTQKSENSEYNMIQVWECDPQALRFNSYSGEKRFFSVSNFDDKSKVLHIYVGRHHPNVAEALVYNFFSFKDYNHTCCTILEVLCRRPVMPTSITSLSTAPWDRYKILSERMAWQLSQSTYKDLARYVMQTHKVLLQLKEANISSRQRYLAVKMASLVKAAAKFLLLDDIQTREETLRQNKAILQYKISSQDDMLQSRLEVIIQECAWRSEPNDVLRLVLSGVNKGTAVYVDSPTATLPKFFYDTIVGAGRACALEELEIQVRDANPYLLREPDLVTVYMEFNGLTEADSQRLFGMSKFELGRMIYSRIREKMEQTNPPALFFEPDKGAYEPSAPELLSMATFFKRWGDGLFFMLFMAINLAVVLPTGVGAYTSVHMTGAQTQIIALAMIAAFIVAGPVNAGISRLGSLYLYQWSFSLAFTLLTRFIVMGLLIAACIAGLVGIPTIIIHNPYNGLIFILYFFLFVTTLLFMGALFNIHKGSIWFSIEGWCILGGQFLEMAVVFAIFYLLPPKTIDGPLVHIIGLAVCAAVLGTTFFFLAHQHTLYIEHVNPTSEKDVLTWYATITGLESPPLATANDQAFADWYGRVYAEKGAEPNPNQVIVVRWAKKMAAEIWDDARAAFAKEIKKQFTRPSKSNDIISTRAKDYKYEELLMKWYVLLTSKPRPDAFSKQWDILLAEAKDAYQVKTKTDSVLRGGLLWEAVAPYMWQGTFYYLLLFSDRIVQLLYTGEAKWFTPTSRYELTEGWALVCLLLSIGCLEAIPLRISAFELTRPLRLSASHNDIQLIKAYNRFLMRSYWSDMLRVFVVYIFCCLFCGGFLVWYAAEYTLVGTYTFSSEILLYLIFIFGYCGFVLGCYNALYISRHMPFIALSLASSTLVGVIVGLIISDVLKNSDASATALVVGGWFYFGITARKVMTMGHFGREKKVQAKWGALQSPAMMTSGQKWVGTKWEETDTKNPKVEHLLEHLISAKCVVLTPSNDIGLEVADILRKSLHAWEAMPPECLLKTAFPQAGSMFTTVLQLWSQEKIVLTVLEEGDLKVSEDEGFAAFSVAMNVKSVTNPEKGKEPVTREISVIDLKASTGLYLNTENNRGTPMVLQVYVALNEFQPAQRLAEALIHEFTEQYLGLSHRRAVMSELLVSPGDGPHVAVPARIVRQINSSSRTKLLQLTDQTEDVVLDAVAEDTLLEMWEALSPAARTLVVAILELPVYASLSPTSAPAPTPDWICARAEISENMFQRGVADLQREGLWPVGDQREHVANLTLAAQLAIAIKKEAVQTTANRMQAYSDHHQPIVSTVPRYTADDFLFNPTEDLMRRLKADGAISGLTLMAKLDAIFRLGFLGFSADPTFAQEYAFSHSHNSGEGGIEPWMRWITWGYLPVYNIARMMTKNILWVVLYALRTNFKLLYRQLNKGAYGNELYKNGNIARVQHTSPGIPNRTGFVHRVEGAQTSTMDVYPLLVEAEPAAQRGRIATVVYNAQGRADKLVEYAGTNVKTVSLYTYTNKRLPNKEVKYATNDANVVQTPRETIAQNCTPVCEITYDNKGRPTEATLFRDFKGAKIPIKATYRYHADDIDCEPIEVVYNHVPEETITGDVIEVCIIIHYYTYTQRIQYVDWQHQDGQGNFLRTYFNYRNLNNIKKATFKRGEDGEFTQRFLTPNLVRDDPHKLLKNPFVSVRQAVLAPRLKKRSAWFNCFSKSKDHTRELRHNMAYPTLKARIVLWKSWQKGKLEGVFIQLWDEYILRNEPALKKYWMRRDWGMGDKARRFLKEKQHLVTPRVQPEASHPDLRTHIIIKMSDLLGLVPGGYMHDMFEMENNHLDNQLIGSLDDPPTLDVVGIDSGTWPADGGGVAACRRDVVDRLATVSWTQFSEIGNPMKLTQYQIERNIRSLTLIPLWGDIVNDPCALLLTDIPYGTLAAKRWRTTPKVIEKYFIPILDQLVKACSLVNEPTDEHMREQTSMIVNMYTYFQEYDWLKTWGDPLVTATWRSGWCNAYGPGVRQEYVDYKLLDGELPTMQDLDILLSLFGHFLFPITAKLPSHPVYHASHHGIQSILGVVARHLYGSQFIIWDHGMLWREKTKALAELSQFSLFVRNGLLGLSRVAMRANYENADTVTSCCTKGNPDWEIWLGGRNQGVHCKPRMDMYWRMSPVLNGMETDKFSPKPSAEANVPTVVQLSHVYDLKDIKTAIKSAAVIVNQFKVTNFQLSVYGSTTKDLDYTAECRELISAEGLSANANLMGLADATKVLASGWLFFNSSQSEGLPLALGEAGLCALPVVCTDVGGSREVVTGEEVFGRVVPPRNPVAAARAILEVLAMVDSAELDELLKDPKALMARMEANETIRKRRELGAKFRQFVLENFGMERYLKEHEQQLFLGAFRCAERRVEAMTVLENVCVRQVEKGAIRHLRAEVLPSLPALDSLGKAQTLPLFDLYADAAYRMIETAIEKNKINFLRELEARNSTVHTVKHIAPFHAPKDLRSPNMHHRNSVLKYYMSPAVFLPKILGSSSPAFFNKKGGIGSPAAHSYSPAGGYNGASTPYSPSYLRYDGDTPVFPNSPARRTKYEGSGSSALLTNHLMEMFANDPDRQKKVQDLVNALVGRLVRVPNLDDLMRNMDAWIESCMTNQSYEELKKQLEELQIIICDDEGKFSEQDHDAANIQYERIFQAFTKTSEYQAEIAKIAEEKRRINEPLNRAAWENLVRVFSRENIKNEPSIRDRLRENPELGLICMDPKSIAMKHQGDFQMYTLNNLNEEELRAIRAILPKWRSDQKRQADWTDALENKIEQLAKSGPKKQREPRAPKPPPAPGGPGKAPPPPKPKAKAAPAAAGAPAGGDLFAELLARRKRL